jgi:hypothetical protein
MLLVEQSSGRTVDVNAQLTLEEYLALPDDSRCEVVEGILRPMSRTTTDGRRVQRRLTNALEAQCPPDLQVEFVEIVVFHEVPPDARDTRRQRVRPGRQARLHEPCGGSARPAGRGGGSPGSGEEDRHVKPGEYARNGIPTSGGSSWNPGWPYTPMF